MLTLVNNRNKMKKLYLLLMAICFVATSCDETKTVTVTVTNPATLDRQNEMIEVSMADVTRMLQLKANEEVVVNDAEGKELPYQVTHDEKIIFQANVLANKTATYTIQKGKPAEVPVIACGRQYPERVDDIAWENDLVAFRTYGPALQKTGERGFGYDIWTKYNTTEPVVEARYAMELNPETKARIDSLKKTDPKAAAELGRQTSYHFDHGNGHDCYKVGPTLGGGTTALMMGDTIIYPYCYKDFEILDNGPLRFTVKLEYNPLVAGNDSNIIETRIISLDAGSHMNKTIVSYAGLSKTTNVGTGIVLHGTDGVANDAANGYITFVDPTDNDKAGNGKIFVGAAFPAKVDEAKVVLFSEKEKKEERDGGADGHVLAISSYAPGTDYTYYWGSAWDKADIKDAVTWNRYVAGFAQKVRNPLKVEIK